MVTDSSYKNKAYEYLKKAYLLQLDGKYNEAVENYQLSLDIFPTAEAHTFLGWTYSFLGKFDEAIDECKKAIDIDPEFGNPYNDIGSYLIEKGNPDEAITWLELALNVKKTDSLHYTYMNLGRALEMKGLWFEAVDEYQNALDVKSDFELAQKLYYRLQGKMN